MKHIVILSSMYFPDMGAPSACIDKYVRALKEDYLFHIITKTEKIGFALSEEFDIRYITSFRHRLIIQCQNQIKKNKNVIYYKLILLIVNFCKLIQTQFSFPSAQKWEVNAYKEKLEELNREVSIDTIIAVSNTWVTQIATLEFKRNHPEVKWIAFVLDPYWNFYIYYKYKMFKSIWRRLNYKKERDVYETADYCMFTSEMYKYAPEEFKIEKEKVFEIKFSLTKFVINHINNSSNNTCKLIFAGLFYKKIRNPEFALSTLSMIKDIQFDMFVAKGECEEIIKYYERENFHREQFVSHDCYIEKICNEYDVLVNIGNVSTLQAPSKMLELLSSGKPILNFYFTKDSQYEMIEKYPLGLNVGYKENGAVEKVERFCKDMKGRSISFGEVENLFPENNLSIQVELLRKLIES